MQLTNNELREEMYCSQQICIPPTFPYLLRQFAKAAIRTQPNDLLKWSTAYFRCLSLNIPPPVKPRLEYPVPKDFCGITPGWLKALLHQMPGVTHVSFKTLWDRWIGACLHHPDLIKILCLGGFDNPMAIPWLRFIGLCAAHLTESLTKSMILICEVLTEEPEGGSAMIDVEVFNDLYQFLARIDAGKPQMLKNYYFRDSLLGLWEKRIKEDQGPFELPEEVEEEESIASTPEDEEVEQARVKDTSSIVSCPSVEAQEEEEDLEDEIERRLKEDGGEYDASEVRSRDTLLSDEVIPGMLDDDMHSGGPPAKHHRGGTDDEDDDDEDIDVLLVKSEPKESDGGIKLASGRTDEPRDHDGSIEGERHERTREEDIERLRLVQQELQGEDDFELEKLKADLLAAQGLPMTESHLGRPEHYQTKAECRKLSAKVPVKGAGKADAAEAEKAAEEPEVIPDEEVAAAIAAKVKEGDYDEVYVDAVPGIGPIVPEKMIHAVVEFMKNTAKEQQHVVMPRNVRHYECPPLEVLNY